MYNNYYIFGPAYNSQNCVMKNIALSAKSSRSSDFRDNYRYLSYKYNIGIHV